MRTCLVLVVALCAGAHLRAQSGGTAQVAGTVQDSTGGAIPGAGIRVTQTDTGISRSTTSARDGAYALPNLPVGPYQFQVTRDGFSSFVQSGIVLQVGSNVRIDATLQVGALTERVEVTADAAMVESRDSTVGQVIDRERIAELPLNGRQAMQLVTLSGAAVDMTVAGGFVTVRNQPSAVSISVAGGGGNSTTYALDGGNANDSLNNVSMPFPFPDALQEFGVQTTAIPARFGIHPGGSVNAVTKSGTNEFHGLLFEFLRNGIFNARNFFAARQDTLRRNQFGGTVGGPILRNKLFFFYAFQGTINRSDAVASIANVVTAAELAGDFTAAASAACNSNKAVILKGGFVNNQIAPGLLSAPAVKFATSFLPATADPCGRVLFGIPQRDNERQHVGRIDYQLNSRNTIFGRYFVSDYTNPPFFDGKNALTTAQVGLLDRAQNMTVGHTLLLGPATVSSFHASFARSRVNRTDAEMPTPCDIGVNITCLVPKFSSFNVNNFFQIGGTSPGPFNTNALQLTEDVDVIRGAHQIAMGVNWIHTQLNAHSNIAGNGTFLFNGTTSGLGIADFLIGRPASMAQSAEQQIYERSNYLGVYAQDSWKVTPRLTLNYGLRWEPHIQQTNIQDRVSRFSLDGFIAGQKSTVFQNAPAGRTYPGDPGYPGHSASRSTWGVFAPRFAVVFDPLGTGRQKISASYGMFSELPSIYLMGHFPTDPPWGTNIILNNPAGGFENPWQGIAGGNIFPTPNPPAANVAYPQFGTYDSMPDRVHPTTSQQWDLAVQKQFGTDWVVSATYLGNRTTHLWLGRDTNSAVYIPGNCTSGGVTAACSTTSNINQRRKLYLLNPVAGAAYGGILDVDDGGNASYHGLLLSTQHRLNRGFTALVNYTWSHCLSDGEEALTMINTYQDPDNRRANSGNCVSDRRRIFNTSVVAHAPKYQKGIYRALIGDMELATIFTASSGRYFNLLSGVQNSLTGSGNDRPNLVGNPSLANPDFSRWFNTSAYQRNAIGSYGNAGRNTMEGPGQYSLTLALVRKLKLRERYKADVRAEAFNILNHANATVLSTNLNSPTYGQVTAAADPRILQFGLKLAF